MIDYYDMYRKDGPEDWNNLTDYEKVSLVNSITIKRKMVSFKKENNKWPIVKELTNAFYDSFDGKIEKKFILRILSLAIADEEIFIGKDKELYLKDPLKKDN